MDFGVGVWYIVGVMNQGLAQEEKSPLYERYSHHEEQRGIRMEHSSEW